MAAAHPSPSYSYPPPSPSSLLPTTHAHTSMPLVSPRITCHLPPTSFAVPCTGAAPGGGVSIWVALALVVGSSSRLVYGPD